MRPAAIQQPWKPVAWVHDAGPFPLDIVACLRPWAEAAKKFMVIKGRPGARTAYLTLRDPDVDMSLSVSIHVNALDAMPGPATTHRHYELRGSGHLTNAEQWAEAMSETIAWLERYGR